MVETKHNLHGADV